MNEARTSGKFLIFAYVIMMDLHVITDSEIKARVIFRFINGIISRRIIDFLKQRNYSASLQKLRRQEDRRGHKFSLWDHHANARVLTSEETLMQRVHYTHQNPVRAGIIETAEEYNYSSARIWSGRPLENEPLLMDVEKIRWRKKRD